MAAQEKLLSVPLFLLLCVRLLDSKLPVFIMTLLIRDFLYMISCNIQSVVHLFYAFSEIRGGGGVDEFSLRFILLLNGLLCVISVISDFSLYDPRFKAPSVPPPAPPSSDSSSETPDVRRNCIACPRRMSKTTADRHTLCVSCRGFDCDVDTHCEEWLEEEVRLYAKYRKSQIKDFYKI